MPIYIAASFCILLMTFTKPNTILNNRYNSRALLLLLLILSTVYFVLSLDNYRNSDTLIYINHFWSFSYMSFTDALASTNMEYLSTLLIWVLSKVSSNEYFFVGAIWLLSSLFIIYALHQIQTSTQTLIIYLAYINFPLFFDYLMVGMRQGFALVTLFLAVFLLLNKKYKKFYLAILIAPLFHSSAVACSLILLFIRITNIKVKYSVLLWLLFALMFVTGLNGSVFSFLSHYIEDIDYYTSSAAMDRFSGVNRLDFLAFSGFIVLIGGLFYRYATQKNTTYKTILNVYILFNIYFLMFGFIAFSNRVSAYSWFLIPVVLLFPFLNNKKYNPLLAASIIILILLAGVFTGAITEFF